MVISRQVQEFLDARRDSETFQHARQALLASDKAEVLAQFEARLQLADDELRAEAIVAWSSLYGREATDAIIRWLDDPSPMVRTVACTCLQDYGESIVVAALVDRLNHDADSQVRQVAASALGQMGAIEALPDLHHAWQTDFERDELGYAPSGQAESAITSVLTNWVVRQIQGTPPRTFRESTRKGQLIGTVTAESIPLDAQGRILTLRYAHLPLYSFGPGCAMKSDLQTSLVSPFEIEVEYVDPSCVIGRVLIYRQISYFAEFNWEVITILVPQR